MSGGEAPCCAGHLRRGELIGVECWRADSYSGSALYSAVHKNFVSKNKQKKEKKQNRKKKKKKQKEN